MVRFPLEPLLMVGVDPEPLGQCSQLFVFFKEGLPSLLYQCSQDSGCVNAGKASIF